MSEQPLIRTEALCAGYNGIPVVHDLDLTVHSGQVVALLGPNGAGKTTTLLTVSGDLKAISGEVTWKGDSRPVPLHERSRTGLRFVTEERSVFMSLTVEENLRLGKSDIAGCFEMFPELAPLRDRRAGLLSGGEQQMLTLGRALSSGGHMLLADELSLGLAPLVVERLLSAVRHAADDGMGVLLVEQQVRHALAVADYAYVLQRGRVVLHGAAHEVKGQLSEIEASYLSGPATASPNEEEPTQL